MIQVRVGPRGVHGFRKYSSTDIGIEPVAGCSSFGVHRLPTEPIGTVSLTLTNVVAGSAILVRDQSDTTTLYSGTAGASTVNISLSVYSAGNGLNDLRIRVRKGTASVTYQPWETLATISLTPQSIYVSQIPDE